MEINSTILMWFAPILLPGVLIAIGTLGSKVDQLQDQIPKSVRTFHSKKQSKSSEHTKDQVKSSTKHQIVGCRKSMRTSARDNHSAFYYFCDRSSR